MGEPDFSKCQRERMAAEAFWEERDNLFLSEAFEPRSECVRTHFRKPQAEGHMRE
jgi:hypothetical protein